MLEDEWVWPPTHEEATNYAGFVYIITNTMTDKYYIGQKKFWSERTLTPLKGKKRARHKIIESDWRDYWGSSKELLDDIKKYSKENFTRMIIHLCKFKAEMNYLETKEQFTRDVLFDPLSYNKMINCRIGGNQLKNLNIPSE